MSVLRWKYIRIGDEMLWLTYHVLMGWQVLDLSNNPEVGKEGAEALAAAIKAGTCPHLEVGRYSSLDMAIPAVRMVEWPSMSSRRETCIGGRCR